MSNFDRTASHMAGEYIEMVKEAPLHIGYEDAVINTTSEKKVNNKQTINNLINLFTSREISYKDAEVLYDAIALIHRLEDENVVLKGRIDGHSCLPGNH